MPANFPLLPVGLEILEASKNWMRTFADAFIDPYEKDWDELIDVNSVKQDIMKIYDLKSEPSDEYTRNFINKMSDNDDFWSHYAEQNSAVAAKKDFIDKRIEEESANLSIFNQSEVETLKARSAAAAEQYATLPSLGDRWSYSFRLGEENVLVQKDMDDAMNASVEGDDTKLKAALKRKKALEEAYEDKPEGVLFDVAATLPYMMENIRSGQLYGVAGAAAGAVAALALRQPQYIVPFASTGYKLGSSVGGLYNMMKLATGDFYGEAKELGVHDSIAVPMSVLAAVPYALVERMQLDEVMGNTLSNVPYKKRLIQAMVKPENMERLGNFLKNSRVASAAVDLAFRTIGESAEEGVQSVIENSSLELQKLFENVLYDTGLSHKSAMDIAKEAMYDFTSSLGVMGIISLPGMSADLMSGKYGVDYKMSPLEVDSKRLEKLMQKKGDISAEELQEASSLVKSIMSSLTEAGVITEEPVTADMPDIGKAPEVVVGKLPTDEDVYYSLSNAAETREPIKVKTENEYSKNKVSEQMQALGYHTENGYLWLPNIEAEPTDDIGGRRYVKHPDPNDIVRSRIGVLNNILDNVQETYGLENKDRNFLKSSIESTLDNSSSGVDFVKNVLPLVGNSADEYTMRRIYNMSKNRAKYGESKQFSIKSVGIRSDGEFYIQDVPPGYYGDTGVDEWLSHLSEMYGGDVILFDDVEYKGVKKRFNELGANEFAEIMRQFDRAGYYPLPVKGDSGKALMLKKRPELEDKIIQKQLSDELKEDKLDIWNDKDYIQRLAGIDRYAIGLDVVKEFQKRYDALVKKDPTTEGLDRFKKRIDAMAEKYQRGETQAGLTERMSDAQRFAFFNTLNMHLFLKDTLGKNYIQNIKDSGQLSDIQDLTKRFQILSSKGTGYEAPDFEGVVNENGAVKAVVVDKIWGHEKDVENDDGLTIVDQDLFDRYVSAYGADTEDGIANMKSFVYMTPQMAKNLGVGDKGAVLGKLKLTRATDSDQQILSDKGVKVLFHDTAAKFRGSRAKNEVFDLDPTSMRTMFVEHNDFTKNNNPVKTNVKLFRQVSYYIDAPFLRKLLDDNARSLMGEVRIAQESPEAFQKWFAEKVMKHRDYEEEYDNDEMYAEALEESKGVSAKIMQAMGYSKISALNGLTREYAEAAIFKYLSDSILSPNIRGHIAILSGLPGYAVQPNNGEHGRLGREIKSDEEIVVGSMFRNFKVDDLIKNGQLLAVDEKNNRVDVKAKTLGELFQNYKNIKVGVYTPRAPVGDVGGVRAQFIVGIGPNGTGTSAFMTKREFNHLGGADSDWDKAAIYFENAAEFHDVLKNKYDNGDYRSKLEIKREAKPKVDKPPINRNIFDLFETAKVGKNILTAKSSIGPLMGLDRAFRILQANNVVVNDKSGKPHTMATGTNYDAVVTPWKELAVDAKHGGFEDFNVAREQITKDVFGLGEVDSVAPVFGSESFKKIYNLMSKLYSFNFKEGRKWTRDEKIQAIEDYKEFVNRTGWKSNHILEEMSMRIPLPEFSVLEDVDFKKFSETIGIKLPPRSLQFYQLLNDLGVKRVEDIYDVKPTEENALRISMVDFDGLDSSNQAVRERAKKRIEDHYGYNATKERALKLLTEQGIDSAPFDATPTIHRVLYDIYRKASDFIGKDIFETAADNIKQKIADGKAVSPHTARAIEQLVSDFKLAAAMLKTGNIDKNVFIRHRLAHSNDPRQLLDALSKKIDDLINRENKREVRDYAGVLMLGKTYGSGYGGVSRAAWTRWVDDRFTKEFAEEINSIYNSIKTDEKTKAETARREFNANVPQQVAGAGTIVYDESAKWKGSYKKGSVALVNLANVTPQEAVKVLKHELVHKGLYEMSLELGGHKELFEILRSAKKQFYANEERILEGSNFKSIKELADYYGLDPNTDVGEFKLLGELAARWGEKLEKGKSPSWWKRFIGSIRNWIKQFTGADLTEDQVNEVVAGFVNYGVGQRFSEASETQGGSSPETDVHSSASENDQREYSLSAPAQNAQTLSWRRLRADVKWLTQLMPDSLKADYKIKRMIDEALNKMIYNPLSPYNNRLEFLKLVIDRPHDKLYNFNKYPLTKHEAVKVLTAVKEINSNLRSMKMTYSPIGKYIWKLSTAQSIMNKAPETARWWQDIERNVRLHVAKANDMGNRANRVVHDLYKEFKNLDVSGKIIRDIIENNISKNDAMQKYGISESIYNLHLNSSQEVRAIFEESWPILLNGYNAYLHNTADKLIRLQKLDPRDRDNFIASNFDAFKKKKIKNYFTHIPTIDKLEAFAESGAIQMLNIMRKHGTSRTGTHEVSQAMKRTLVDPQDVVTNIEDVLADYIGMVYKWSERQMGMFITEKTRNQLLGKIQDMKGLQKDTDFIEKLYNYFINLSDAALARYGKYRNLRLDEVTVNGVQMYHVRYEDQKLRTVTVNKKLVDHAIAERIFFKYYTDWGGRITSNMAQAASSLTFTWNLGFNTASAVTNHWQKTFPMYFLSAAQIKEYNEWKYDQYRLFDFNGKKITYDELLNHASRAVGLEYTQIGGMTEEFARPSAREKLIDNIINDIKGSFKSKIFKASKKTAELTAEVAEISSSAEVKKHGKTTSMPGNKLLAFSKAEMSNKKYAFNLGFHSVFPYLVSSRMAAGMSEEDAVMASFKEAREAGIKMMTLTQYDYHVYNSPEILRKAGITGDALRMFLMYKKFTIGYYKMIKRGLQEAGTSIRMNSGVRKLYNDECGRVASFTATQFVLRALSVYLKLNIAAYAGETFAGWFKDLLMWLIGNEEDTGYYTKKLTPLPYAMGPVYGPWIALAMTAAEANEMEYRDWAKLYALPRGVSRNYNTVKKLYEAGQFRSGLKTLEAAAYFVGMNRIYEPYTPKKKFNMYNELQKYNN